MLFNLKEYRFYICPGPFDMRAGVWRLVEHMDNRKLDVHDRIAYVVCGKSRKCIKIVLWNNGYWMLQKHIEGGTFCWPRTADEAKRLTVNDMERLLDGQNIFRKIEDRTEPRIY